MYLCDLGLTKNESKAFESLVILGKSGASAISAESGVPYSRIYDVLASLEQKGLVKVLPEKGKKFVPGDPQTLKILIENRRKQLEDLEKEVGRLKAIYDVKEKEPVEIAKGKRNFYKIEKEMEKPKKLEYNIKYNVEYRPEWEREYKNNFKRNVVVKELVRSDEETKENIHTWLKAIKLPMREIPNDGIAISIKDDSEILISLIKSNTLLLIRDKPFIKMMKELFEKYYEQAKKVS